MVKNFFHLTGTDMIILNFLAEYIPGISLLMKGMGGMMIGKYLAPIFLLAFIYHAIPSGNSKKN